MSLFKKLFIDKTAYFENQTAVICLLGTELMDFDTKSIENEIHKYQETASNVVVEIEQNPSVGQGILLGRVLFEKHIVEIGGVPAPITSAVANRCITSTAWDSGIKDRLLQHNSNIILQYAGASDDGIEQYLALYKVANALNKGQLIGLINEPAWNCHTIDWVSGILQPDIMAICKNSPPLHLWAGFLSSTLNGRRCFFTRGFHIFGLSDLACYQDVNLDGQGIFELFEEVFHYLYFNTDDIQEEDIIKVNENQYYILTKPTENEEMLNGIGGCWILSHTTEQESIN